MKKILASVALIAFVFAISVPATASFDGKPTKAKTEQCTNKKDCPKSTSCEKSCCGAKTQSTKATVEKK